MHSSVKVLICVFILSSLTACGMIRSFRDYREPTQGPRAKVRVYEGAQTRIYPGQSCYGDSNNKTSGIVGKGFVSLFTSNRSLEIPMKPERGNYDEYYIPADVPVSISFYYDFSTQTQRTTCGPLGMTFTPKQDENYEAAFEFRGRICSYSLNAIVKDAAGNYQKQNMKPTAASSCPND